ncbi:ribosomal protein S6--L-glutamate ligase/gamma-F420-2:alpha-L-glutamate ligase [Psychrobacillus sp. OK028]|uniref:ATP-grasp domain-containing protein n=1 Tax=Psychrobacillus sp. OK028 TaxID=1884359 RepID=UPI00088D9F8C|nr:ATP-grasp domain-containing protein [Psychrobacillus sp. OK028]SDM79603.1 ribosomal protein S6--L-glutamate ligase/gamma-F420-2:alpha-L-glutamate ligase [Psychrobacillus sp. OK028]
MKGLLIYEKAEIERNQSFIDRLINAASTHGHNLTVVDDQSSIPKTDFIFFRSRNPQLAKELEQRNIPMFNRAEVNVVANDKLKAIQLVQLLGIATVPTIKIKTVSEINEYPVVLKTINGHGGKQVELVHTEKEATTFLNTFSEYTIIAQKYIETNATDVRVFMLGEEVLGAVKRTGPQDSFKSNFTLGGTVEKYTLDNQQREAVEKIAKALKSDYIGIDFLLLPDGNWLFNETEDPVGARSYFETTKKDIALPIMEYIHKKLTKNERDEI